MMLFNQEEELDHVHSYPAKFTVGLANTFINKYSKERDIIYDPFVGSGTTMLSASCLNRYSLGTDINYIAVLITKFKLLDLSNGQIDDLRHFIEAFQTNYNSEVKTVDPFRYPSIDHWFCADSIAILSLIKANIAKVVDGR